MKMLEVVNENDEVVGLESSLKIHQEGLLHREIHLWFITPDAKIIFQRRAKNKDTFPDKFDATVGGHVEPKMSYDETVIKECKEETGLNLVFGQVVFLSKFKIRTFDDSTGLINNSFRTQFAYLYNGNINQLAIEVGKGQGFKAWKIDRLEYLSEIDKAKFIPIIFSSQMLNAFYEARRLLGV